jgi:hypothetical protein
MRIMLYLYWVICMERWPAVLVLHRFRSAPVLQQCKRSKQDDPDRQCLSRVAHPVVTIHG